MGLFSTKETRTELRAARAEFRTVVRRDDADAKAAGQKRTPESPEFGKATNRLADAVDASPPWTRSYWG